MFRRGLLALALAASIGLPAFSQQPIGVTVNGDAVRFETVGPQQIHGRVLVPLRGVMEKLGAYVGWDPQNQMVTANRGDVDIELTIGRNFARVNGKEVALDVPAQIYRGSTLVPLRFMSEALGADVKWNASTNSVDISTTVVAGGGNPPPTTGNTAVAITSFDVDRPDGYLRRGSVIRFTMVGTPGGTASLQIPGVTEEIMLRETQAGTYTGSYTVPNREEAINIAKASAIGRLKIGNTERLIQSGISLDFDTAGPKIGSLTPEPDTRVNRPRPNITATFDDANGSGVDQDTVRILLDGKNVTQDATVTGALVAYKPDTALGAGVHEVEIRARDRAGNEVSRHWSFRVTQSADVIKSFDYEAKDGLRAGEEVTFLLIGEPGGTATYTIGDRIRARRMDEVEPGKYVGTYTIRQADQFDDMAVTARLKTKSGEEYTIDASKRFGTIGGGTLTAPKISEPEAGTKLPSVLVIRGTAPANSRVQIRIDYNRSVLGALNLRGVAFDEIIDVDSSGHFETKDIRITGIAGSSGTEYTITATTLGANDKKSEATKLTIRK